MGPTSIQASEPDGDQQVKFVSHRSGLLDFSPILKKRYGTGREDQDDDSGTVSTTLIDVCDSTQGDSPFVIRRCHSSSSLMSDCPLIPSAVATPTCKFNQDDTNSPLCHLNARVQTPQKSGLVSPPWSVDRNTASGLPTLPMAKDTYSVSPEPHGGQEQDSLVSSSSSMSSVTSRSETSASLSLLRHKRERLQDEVKTCLQHSKNLKGLECEAWKLSKFEEQKSPVRELKATVKSLSLDLELERTRNRNLAQAISRLEDDFRQKDTIFESQEVDAKKNKEEILRLSCKLDVLKGELEKLKQKNRKFQNEVEEKDTLIDSLHSEKVELSKKLETLSKKCDEIEKERSKAILVHDKVKAGMIRLRNRCKTKHHLSNIKAQTSQDRVQSLERSLEASRELALVLQQEKEQAMRQAKQNESSLLSMKQRLSKLQISTHCCDQTASRSSSNIMTASGN